MSSKRVVLSLLLCIFTIISPTLQQAALSPNPANSFATSYLSLKKILTDNSAQVKNIQVAVGTAITNDGQKDSLKAILLQVLANQTSFNATMANRKTDQTISVTSQVSLWWEERDIKLLIGSIKSDILALLLKRPEFTGMNISQIIQKLTNLSASAAPVMPAAAPAAPAPAAAPTTPFASFTPFAPAAKPATPFAPFAPAAAPATPFAPFAPAAPQGFSRPTPVVSPTSSPVIPSSAPAVITNPVTAVPAKMSANVSGNLNVHLTQKMLMAIPILLLAILLS